jgi:hypothetical protein
VFGHGTFFQAAMDKKDKGRLSMIRKLSKSDLLKCLLGYHNYNPKYPEAKKSPLICVNCGYKKKTYDFNEEKYEWFRFVATLADGIK